MTTRIDLSSGNPTDMPAFLVMVLALIADGQIKASMESIEMEAA
jgi:hypothetical protein